MEQFTHLLNLHYNNKLITVRKIYHTNTDVKIIHPKGNMLFTQQELNYPMQSKLKNYLNSLIL